MAIELVTGYAGSAHISAADDGAFNMGAFGAGKYVFETASQLAASVVNANTVSVAAGDALFEGRHVRLASAETVSIDNGAQGVKRHDIVCIKYEKASGTNVESATLAVVKGTAAANPVDPTIPSGSIASGSSTAYMPLWRIPLDGISVGTPEKLYGDVIPPLYDAINKTWSLSQIPNLPASKTTSGTFPIARGGTNASTAAGALQNIMAGKSVLYNNVDGTTGTVTLSQSSANFNHMRVYATSPYGDVSVDLYNPNGKDFTISAISTDNSGMTTMYIVQQRRNVSGTSMTVHDNGYAWILTDSGTNQATSVNANAYVKVIRVEAWNE